MKPSPLLASLLIVVSACCCRSWESLIANVFSVMNTTEPIGAEQLAQEMTGASALPVEIQNFQAARYDFPGFTNYYLRYEVDNKDWALAWVESLPTAPSAEIKPEQMLCETARENLVKEDFFPMKQVADLSQVEFWHPEQVVDKEYYTCLRFPWNHSLLFDMASKTVYPVIQEIRD